MVLGSFPETNATSDENPEPLWEDQNLQTNETSQARVIKHWFAHDNSNICLLFWLSDLLIIPSSTLKSISVLTINYMITLPIAILFSLPGPRVLS